MNPKNRQNYEDTTIKIQDAFGNLLLKKPLSNISVKDICEEAEIHRTTFYTHFTDINDLETKMTQMLIQQFFNNYDISSDFHFKNKIKEQLDYLYHYRKLIKKQLSQNSMATFTYISDSNISFEKNKTAQKYLAEKNLLSQVPHPMQFYALTYTQTGYLHVLLQWIANDCQESSEEIANFLYNMFLNVQNYF